jgi:hypothetical protein
MEESSELASATVTLSLAQDPQHAVLLAYRGHIDAPRAAAQATVRHATERHLPAV